MIEKAKDVMARHEHVHGSRTHRRRGIAGVAGVAGVAERMAAFLLVSTSLLLAACGSTPTISVSTPLPLPTAASATPTPVPTVLFQADWSHGLAGWKATPGWSIVNGALETDTGSGRTLTIPYQLSVSDYEIEVDMQIVSIPHNDGYFMIHALPQPGADGYEAGVTGLRAPNETRPNGDHPTLRSDIDPLSSADPYAFSLAQHDYEPGPDVRQYLVIVQGSAIKVGVDGRFPNSNDSIQTPRLSNGPIQIECAGAVFRVTALRIFTL